MSFVGEVLTDEKSMKAFKRTANDMYMALHLILTLLGMTEENAMRMCKISTVYWVIFDYEHKAFKLSTQGVETLNKWKVFFGDKDKEEKLISSLMRD